MLKQNGVAKHKIRRRKSGNLIVRVVPRHDAEQRAYRQLADYGRAFGLALNRSIFKEELAVSA